MKVKKSDVYIGDIMYTEEEEYLSCYDEEVHSPNFEFKRPKYKIRERSILVIRVYEGKFIKPQHLSGLLDFLILKRNIEKKKRYDARVIRDSRNRYEDDFIGNLRPRFEEDGFIDLEELKREGKQKYVIIDHTV